MISQIHSVGFTVSDIDRILPFYTEALSFRVLDDAEVWGPEYERLTGIFGARLRIVTLQLGAEQIQLTQFIAPPGGRPVPADSRSHDLWFQHLAIVVNDMDAAYAHLKKYAVQHVSTAPQTLPETIPAAAGIRAFYFRDPDGHNLELIAFPAGKGHPRWQSGRGLFLGIDHTAIAVSRTKVSRTIYEAFGWEQSGESLNFGTEQEHLNGVFGCRVQITGWRPHPKIEDQAGMGIEFLDYLAPAGGRPMPQDSRANDLWHWEITLLTDDIEAAFRHLNTHLGDHAVSEIVTLPEAAPLGCRRAFTLRDADAHALKIIEV